MDERWWDDFVKMRVRLDDKEKSKSSMRDKLSVRHKHIFHINTLSKLNGFIASTLSAPSRRLRNLLGGSYLFSFNQMAGEEDESEQKRQFSFQFPTFNDCRPICVSIHVIKRN